MKIKLLISLTSTPERLKSDFIFRVLDSMLFQKTGCEFRVVIFIPHHSLRTGAPYPDPDFLHDRYGRDRIMVHRCDDMGPATKFAGFLTCLAALDNEVTHIYITDDDIILRDDILDKVTRRLELFSDSTEADRLVLANHITHAPGLPLVSGFAGILVPIGFFRALAADIRLGSVWERLAEGSHSCFNADDILLSRLFKRFGYKVEWTKLDAFVDVMDRTKTDEHPKWFELCKHTPRNLHNLRCLNEPLP